MAEIVIPPIEWNVVFPIAVLFVWSAVLLLVDLFIADDRKRLTGYLALAGLAATALASIPQWGLNTSTFGDMLVIDGFGLSMNVICLIGAALTIIMALAYLPRQLIDRGEFYVLILLATGGVLLLNQGRDLIVLFLGLELLSITLYVLAGFARPQIASEEAGMKYLLIGAFATGFFVFGIALLYGGSGSANLRTIGTTLAAGLPAGENGLYVLAGAALVLVGLSYKTSLVPFHMWTPDVYAGAPTPVTAFMSTASKVGAFAGLTRFLIEAIGPQRAAWLPALAALVALTLLVGNIGALTQTGLKRLLAYSSIGQAGFVLLGVVAGGVRGIEALTIYLLAYTLANMAVFGVLVALERGGEQTSELRVLNGLWRRRPWLAVALVVGLLSLAGVPPTAGFVAKLAVFTAAWEAGLAWLVVVGIIASMIGAYVYLRMAIQVFAAEEDAPELVRENRQQIGVALAAIATVVLGVIPAPLFALAQQAAQSLASR